jgi:alpha-glucosidase (family GH31 glycosyl hydrolase)
VRGGTILASSEIQQHVEEKKIEELTLDIWPDRDRVATFTVYDDDGETMAYEGGAWFRQSVTAKQQKRQIVVSFGAPEGAFATAIKRYRLRAHNWSSEGEVVEAIAEAGVAGKIVIPKS